MPATSASTSGLSRPQAGGTCCTDHKPCWTLTAPGIWERGGGNMSVCFTESLRTEAHPCSCGTSAKVGDRGFPALLWEALHRDLISGREKEHHLRARLGTKVPRCHRICVASPGFTEAAEPGPAHNQQVRPSRASPSELTRVPWGSSFSQDSSACLYF